LRCPDLNCYLALYCSFLDDIFHYSSQELLVDQEEIGKEEEDSE